MPQPELRSTHAGHVMVGERLRLTCVLRVKRGDVISVTWDYTSNEVQGSVRGSASFLLRQEDICTI